MTYKIMSMKKLILLLLLSVFTTLAAFAQSEDFYDACRADSNIETIYIGSPMLRMVKTPGFKINGVELDKIVSIIDNIRIVTADNAKGIKKLNELTAIFSSKNGYEVMLENSDKDEHVVMYTKKLKNKLNEYVIIPSEPNEKTVIIITGNLTPEDLAKAKK